ncbi:hypothetical protein L873DRAFT_1490350 [Choiromyces venosus 120613-1]|uniref:Uncharacterized protein n=1 Tax=Choiromyces venosus 120613-1 TaxID=1336337 RepID=A0A3N4JAH9_9PEZI|nr:hypothetical protein L873DRAFT_1490350 [Choiromyces venosus 120613-1]
MSSTILPKIISMSRKKYSEPKSISKLPCYLHLMCSSNWSDLSNNNFLITINLNNCYIAVLVLLSLGVGTGHIQHSQSSHLSKMG